MSKLVLRVAMVATLAGLVAGLGAGTAAATRQLALNPGGAISLVNDGLTRIGLPVDTTMFQCQSEFNGSLARSIAKTPGASVGTLTSATFSGCHTSYGAYPEVTVLPGPWNIAYRGYVGRLPRRHGRSPRSAGYVEVTIEDFSIYDTWLDCLRTGDLPARIHFSGSPMVSGLLEIEHDNVQFGTGDCVNLDFHLWGSYSIAPQQTLTRVR